MIYFHLHHCPILIFSVGQRQCFHQALFLKKTYTAPRKKVLSATSSHNGCIVLAHQIKETKSGSFNFSITLTKWALLHFAPYLLAIRRKKCEEECKKIVQIAEQPLGFFATLESCFSKSLFVNSSIMYSASENDHK